MSINLDDRDGTTLAVCFTNFGPYHLARLRALGSALADRGGRLVAYEVAGKERRYPWESGRGRRSEPFDWQTLFPGRAVESVPGPACALALRRALGRDRPDAVAVAGYARAESMAAANWARSHGRPAILMSETQAIDHPRVWWKEAVKRRRVSRFSAALAGGPRHRDYLAALGMPPARVALGYNAVDNDRFARAADSARRDPAGRAGLPAAPYFLAVSRFVPEKNLPMLVRAYADYRAGLDHRAIPWDLVLCGDGPAAAEVNEAIATTGFTASIHRPGFLQADGLARWYAHAGAFVHPSLMEPWGLVANEAAACGTPLILSDRAGCAETLVPDPSGTTGWRFDPRDPRDLADSLAAMAALSPSAREAMGRRAADRVADWGPDRFARGMLGALRLAIKAGPQLVHV